MSKHSASDDDQQFLIDFDTAAFTPAAFDHRAHLRLAYVLLTRTSADEAVPVLRRSLLRFLAAHELPASKFHETLTTAWLMAADVFMRAAAPCTSFAQWIERSQPLLDPNIMLTHYAPERLFSDDARAAFVPPDVSPLRRQGEGTIAD